MIESGFLAVAGGRVEYARWGAGEGGAAAAPAPSGAVAAPVLVLLHEGLGCVSAWRDWPAELARAAGREVFAYSRFGYGRSSPAALPRPLDFMRREAHEVLPRVLEAAGIGGDGDAPPVLVGHSDGGTIALLCAAAQTAPVLGVAALAAHAFNEPRCIQGIEAARDAFRSGELRARLARHHGERTDDTFRGWCDAWLDPGFEHWTVEEELAGMRAPLLVVQGSEDPYGTLRQAEAIAARARGPCEVLVLDGCGHSPHRERAEATTGAVARFAAALA